MTQPEYHYFKASWCGPCEQTTPVAKENDAIIHDVEEEQELANKWAVRALPTLIITESGNPVESLRGTSEILHEFGEL